MELAFCVFGWAFFSLLLISFGAPVLIGIVVGLIINLGIMSLAM